MAYFAATPRRVEFSDTDMAGIAHFSAFFRWMEAAEHELLRSIGLSVFTRFDEGLPTEHAISFPRVHAECDYQSPAKCDDELTIGVTVERIGTKSVSYGFFFTAGDRQIATGKMTSVCCKIVPGSPPDPTPLSEAIAEKLRFFSAG
ncbi:MAG: thioesterase family protein [Planctomycetota bacterium]